MQKLEHYPIHVVCDYLILHGMDPSYTTWVLHESMIDGDIEMLETYKMYKDQIGLQEGNVATQTNERIEAETSNLIRDAETSLFDGCIKYTKMSATMALFKLKAAFGVCDIFYDELLPIICDMLPDQNTLPTSIYAIKRLLKKFDLEYEKIHACINDCCLFRRDLEHVQECPKCGSSRWEVSPCPKMKKQGVPAKVLRYFPIIPRLKRMFGMAEIAEQLRWDHTNKSHDSKMTHPVDSIACETINRKWDSFNSDPRNIRFGLATNGFNPFQDLSSRYSCWPIILATYNLPPKLCMSTENLILTLLIPGPKQPGNDIDVYLTPLIEDLKELWINGVVVYDAFSMSTFNLRAILMWTINDFPAFGNMSGWPTKGRFACPVCRKGTCLEWLSHSRKFAYMGHR
ncbi:unnamed protein product [Prunus armeniaca]